MTIPEALREEINQCWNEKEKRCWRSLKKKTPPENKRMVPRGGIEPSTHGFSVRCSTY